MKNHTAQTTQPTNNGSSETRTNSKEKATDFDSLNDFESKVSEALLSGTNVIETDERIIRYFLKKPQDWQAFQDTGEFIYKNVSVGLKK